MRHWVRFAVVACCVSTPLAGCGTRGQRNAAPDAQAPVLVDAAVRGGQLVPDAATSTQLDSGHADLQRASAGCRVSPQLQAYVVGTTPGQIVHRDATRTFRVHVPPGYQGSQATAIVLMFHGGGGSARQFEQASARMDPIADREGFIAVYPDGTGTLRTWNGPGCCGAAVQNAVDDVGFVSALLDHLAAGLCIDERRVFASGMSNGAILTHRLACELGDRIAAIAPVAGTDMTALCQPARPVPVFEVHGSADGHVPWNGGEGCGPAGVAFTSVTDTIEHWRTRNGCDASTTLYLEQGEGRCQRYERCSAGADLVLCTIEGGGHNWPGGDPPADLVMCPGNGFQSATFGASENIWRFFAAHPLPLR